MAEILIFPSKAIDDYDEFVCLMIDFVSMCSVAWMSSLIKNCDVHHSLILVCLVNVKKS
jgi:hypothetical protein